MRKDDPQIGETFAIESIIMDSISISVPKEKVEMLAAMLVSGQVRLEPNSNFTEISIVPGAIREQDNIPVTGVNGRRIGTAHAFEDGTCHIMIHKDTPEADLIRRKTNPTISIGFTAPVEAER